MRNDYSDLIRDKDFQKVVRQEELILDVTESLVDALDRAGISRAELAARLGRSPAFVSQLLAGGRNLTLRTLSDVAGALGVRPQFVVSENFDIERLTTESFNLTGWGKTAGNKIVVHPSASGRYSNEAAA